MIDVPLAYLAIFPDSQARGLDVVPQTIARLRSGGDPETADLLEKIIYPVGHARQTNEATTVSNRLAHVEVCALERPHRAAVLFLSCLQCTSVIFEVVAHKFFIALASFKVWPYIYSRVASGRISQESLMMLHLLSPAGLSRRHWRGPPWGGPLEEARFRVAEES
jgi:hypothetical protein